MSINLLTLPVLYSTTTQPAQLLEQWAAIYLNGHRKGPAISLAAGLAYWSVAFERASAGHRWGLQMAAGALTIGMIPYTWIFMLGTNGRLFNMLAEARGGKGLAWQDVQKQVRVWDQLNAVRAWFPLAGAIVGMAGIILK